MKASYYDVTGRGEWAMSGRGPALTSCGYTSSNSDYIVAMSHKSMNKSWMCGKKIWIWSNNRSPVSAVVVDTMMDDSRGSHDLDMSPKLFEYFAPRSKGITNVSWNWA